MCVCVKTSIENDKLSKGGLGMCEPNDFLFNMRVFTFWFDRESIIPGNFGFSISVCRLRKRGVCLRVCMCVCFTTQNY